ncbi:hypothetical protein SCLCIDRAFT_1220060 [Scleroderma citrinum Foug A]|uniref:Uncharacterized protein n=1 Tax=Scleroderma citrinum Foug A TaxID=1036808 RepID=A0A0C3DKE3_9AGAM|nr:hypothetical protein SCLCIDRAFT_1220060 [Scleroderma citrinum Foug A]
MYQSYRVIPLAKFQYALITVGIPSRKDFTCFDRILPQIFELEGFWMEIEGLVYKIHI